MHKQAAIQEARARRRRAQRICKSALERGEILHKELTLAPEGLTHLFVGGRLEQRHPPAHVVREAALRERRLAVAVYKAAAAFEGERGGGGDVKEGAGAAGDRAAHVVVNARDETARQPRHELERRKHHEHPCSPHARAHTRACPQTRMCDRIRGGGCGSKHTLALRTRNPKP